ncbi:long-chain-fatty-acid--CoA ligase [Saccharopolyspora terrae]|uniref:Long-chain-fatty-acid--CoA ligase n=1 Tax=Saccharopolyspora terrae TaxID=2530384 RepID=A0A4R4VJ21_9PSEU|nr:long-chain fatty acid--CoA ligase [Saccharopolyspora terrae]TDD02793.1 long-chain-fatty-acid--CoA ligase [Saccharopolyspora terrae]
MRNEGTGSWPHRRFRLSPEKIAISFRDRRITYRELDDRVTRLAHALRELGVGRGDRVALLSANHPAYLEALFASGLLGAIFVPLNARLTAPEVEFALRDSGASVLIHSQELTEVARAASGSATRVVMRDGDAPADTAGYEDLIASAGTARIDEPVSHDDPCFIMYTSGTTGRPKGVVLTHGNIVFSVMNAVIDLDLTSDETALVCAPLFHTAALDFVALPTLLKGGNVVIEEGFEPGPILRTLESERITYTFGVPTMFDALSSHPDWTSTDLSAIRRVTVAAAPVPPRTLRTYAERGIKICQGYGLTETGPGALILTPDDVERKRGTAGVPHFFTDVRVVDEEGRDVAPGERGEIQICGPNVMREYWNRPDATADAFTDGLWFRSGDVGLPDVDGFVTIVDRLKDMIISGGENVYPAEIEAVLLEMPGVTSCAVFGIPDEKWGEVGCAAVSLDDGHALTHEQMVEYLGERLAKYKIPKSLLVLDEIPRNATGKIRKSELRRLHAR